MAQNTDDQEVGVAHVAMGLIFFYCSTSLQPEWFLLVYRGMYNSWPYQYPPSCSIHLESVDLVALPHDDFLEIVRIFRSDYFDYRCGFRIVPDLHCCGTG